MDLTEIVNKLIIEENIDEQDFSLLSGRLAKALLYSNLCEVKYEKEIYKEIELSLKYVNENRVDTSFVSGLSGFGWSMNFILRNGNHSTNENDLLTSLDILLKETCLESIRNNNFEFFYGATGYLVYFLERCRSSYEAKVILDELACVFLKSLDCNVATLDKQSYEGKVDLSITHGYSGILSILGKLSKNDFYPELCYEKIDSISSYIQGNSLRKNGHLIAPDFVEKGKKYFSPLRWCHGQLGITKALSQIAMISNSSSIDNFIHELSLSLSLITNTSDQELLTPAFCHGTFGVAHTLQHIYDNTKDDTMLSAIEYWYDCSYKLFEQQSKGEYLKENSKKATGLLNGIEGIVLMILDNKKQLKNKGWDESLLF